MNLSEEKYSPFERKVFALLAKKPKSTTAITDAVWGAERRRPRYARQSVLGALTSLSEKVKANREPFAVKKSERTGPHPIMFWVEK
jgi:hypothetical protein